ncbi:MAG: PQQ-binding-like beta-propeller repeat protein [Bacteroidetes bacterium]|nr:PQQ-binding-like beta-propeller repeat protein [Bacteroidota bacterium]
MKKSILITAIALGSACSISAQEFPVSWESEFESRASVLSVVSDDGKYVLGTDKDEMTLLDENGKLVYNGRYKEITGKEGVNKPEMQYVYFDAGLLFLFDKKMGKDRMAVVDVKTGKNLWNSNEYQNITDDNMEYVAELDAFFFSQKDVTTLVNARTGEKIWQTDKFKGSIGAHLYLKESNDIIMINFKPNQLSALFSCFQNQVARINAKTGEAKWSKKHFGFVEKEVVTRKPIVTLYVKNDKIYVQLDGLQVFDFATGKELWKAVYETDMDTRRGFWNRGPHGGKVLDGGIYGAIAPPLYTKDAVYVVMGGERQKVKYVQKHDIETGKLVWESEKITGASAMPHLYENNGKIIAQIGGLINKQTIERKVVKTQTTEEIITYRNSEYEFLGGYGILALDPASGNKAWRSEKFDKRISDLIFDGTMLYAGGGDEFYGFDVATGEMKINVDHSKNKVGKTMWAFDNGESVALVCDKGMAAYSKKDGNKLYNSDKFRNVTAYHVRNGKMFLRNETESSNKIAQG